MRFSELILMKKLGKLKFFAVLVFSVFIVNCCTSAAYADTINGLYTDSRDVRWEYSIYTNVIDGVNTYSGGSVRFFDKPSTMTEIVLPSVEDIAALSPDIEAIADTAYYNLLESSNETHGETKRVSTANVTKLDMTNAHDVVVLGVDSILNQDTEVELVFGDDVVIGDYGQEYKTRTSVTIYYVIKDEFGNINGSTTAYADRFIPNWDQMTDAQKANVGTADIDKTSFCQSHFGIAQCDDYIWNFSVSTSTSVAGVFAGYKVKLTGLQKVKYIGENAFYGATFDNSSLDLAIGNEQEIGRGAFAGTNIKSINYDAKIVADSAFLNCKSLESITLGEHVELIRGNAFAETTAFTGTIVFPSSLTETNGEIFRGSGVSGITFGGAMEVLNFRTFMNTNINSVDFTNSGIKKIHCQAFVFATLNDINFGDVENLDFAAFAYTTFLKPLSFAGSNVETIGTQSFYGASLTIGDFGNVENLNYGSFAATNLGTLNFTGSKIKDIPTRAFYKAGITDLTLDGVQSISYESFAFNELTELFLPKSIKSLNSVRLFVGNYNLTKLTIAYDTMTSGTSYPFHHVLGEKHNETTNGHRSMAHTITDLILIAPYSEGEEVSDTHNAYNQHSSFSTNISHSYTDDYNETYGGRADTYKNVLAPFYFYGFTYLENLTIGEGYEFIGTNAFYTYGSNNPSGSFGTSNYSWEWLYNSKNTQALKNISLPSTLKGIGANAFAQNLQEMNINFPESLEYIGEKAFFNDVNLKVDLDLPNLRYIGKHAFYVSGIHNLYLHDKISFLGATPFAACYNLHDITIDFDVFSINGGALFYNYQGNQTYTFGAAMLSASQNITDSEGMDNNVPIGMTWNQKVHKLGTVTFTDKVVTQPLIYDTRGSHHQYPWFYIVAAEKIDLGETGWKALGAGAFLGANVGEIILPKNLEYIGACAFQSTILEKELVIPDSVKVINNDAFNNYASSWSTSPYDRPIKITKLPSSLEYIGGAAFQSDNQLTAELNLPNLKVIGKSAFMWTPIEKVTLPSSLIGIYSGTFQKTTELKDIVIDCDFYGILNSPRNDYNYSYQGGFTIDGPYNTSSRMDTISFFTTFNKFSDIHYPYLQETIDDSYESVTFTDKNTTEPTGNGGFSYASFGKLDMGDAKWKTLGTGNTKSMFSHTTINKLILPSQLETITEGAFYGASVSGDLVVPSTVKSIGWSAFNAGDVDTNYGTVTIKPALDYNKTNNQAIFQIFWNAKMDKLVIESPMLPVLGTLQAEPVMPHEGQIWGLKPNGTYGYITATPTLRADGEPEFHAMTMREVEITNLPEITANAFEECGNLEKVTFSGDAALSRIDKYAFNNATKLKQVVFGEANNGKDINLHEYAFNNTAIENMVTADDSDFNLAAANFRLADEHVFSNMPKLKTVDIPNNFNIDESLANADKNTNGSYITSFTFADDPELAEVTIGYQVSEIRDGAFLNDEKLSKLFVWGNTEIQESDQLIQDFNNTTIPQGTTIFAYSDAPAEAYANDESRNDYDGKFYALDEVLYLTSNKSKVLLEQDEEGNNTGFDKTGLKLYGLRRDGVILEADWQDYNTAFKRTETPEGTNISFEEGRGALGPDDAAIAPTVFDAPKPFNTISLANENFANVDYEFLTMPSSDNPLIIVHYPDGYTGNIRNTTLVSMLYEPEPEPIPDPEPSSPEPEEPEDELEVPDTGSYGALIGAATSSVSIATIIVLGGIFIAKRRKN